MELIIEIIDIENVDKKDHTIELDKAINEIQELILEYCKMGMKPGLKEWVIAKESDHIVEITRITYCDCKVMYECKLITT